MGTLSWLRVRKSAVPAVEPATDPPSGRRKFDTTRWSIVLRARNRDSREALSALCEGYWYPVYCFIRDLGVPKDEAEDITQGFFSELLRRNDLATVDPTRGRFRDWLRTSAKHHLFNERDRQRAKKRGGDALHVDWKDAEARLSREGKCSLPPDRLFNRRWALTVTERVMKRLDEHYATSARSELFSDLRKLLCGEERPTTDAELAAAAGKSEGALRVERFRLKHDVKRRCRQYLLDELDGTVADPAIAESELRELLRALDD